MTSGVLAIIRLRAQEPTDALLDALVAGGVDAVEVTLPTPGALDAVRRWAGYVPLAVGIGTVRTAADASAAIGAGAQFLVTPTMVPEVLGVAEAHDVPTVCGALTPTEIDTAWRRGATAVKVFPVAPVGGAAYVRAVAEPLPDVPLLPTGGVDVESTRDYARSGCVGVGVGGALVAEPLVATEQWSTLTARATSFAAAWSEGSAGRHG